MSVDQKLRDGLAAELGQINPDAESMLVEIESGARRQRTRRTVALLTAAAAAVAVGVVVWAGGALGWLTSQRDVQPAEQPVEPVEWQLDPRGSWVRVEPAGLEAVNWLSKVVDVGGRLVAVGGGQTPVVTSVDGVDWTPVDVPAAELRHLIAGGPGVIASGSTADGDPALWTSLDGLTWTRVDDPQELLSTTGPGLRAVTLGGSGLDSAGGHAPTTWISSDGLTWMPIDAEEDSLDVQDVTIGGPGFVAVGTADLSGEAWGSPPQPADQHMHTAAVWTSADGRTWSRVPHDPSVFSPHPWVEMNTVTAGASGLVALGNADSGVGNGRTLVWTSDDGETWTRILDELDVAGGIDAGVSEVINTGRGYLAMGQRCCEGVNDPEDVFGRFPWHPSAELWTSVDGRSWERIQDDSFATPEEHGTVINDVVETSSGLVAVGSIATQQDSPETESAAVWLMERP